MKATDVLRMALEMSERWLMMLIPFNKRFPCAYSKFERT